MLHSIYYNIYYNDADDDDGRDDGDIVMGRLIIIVLVKTIMMVSWQ